MLSKLSLRFEIVLMLLVKLAIIFVIWKFCFSHPVDKSFVPSDVEHHVFTSNNLTKEISSASARDKGEI